MTAEEAKHDNRLSLKQLAGRWFKCRYSSRAPGLEGASALAVVEMEAEKHQTSNADRLDPAQELVEALRYSPLTKLADCAHKTGHAYHRLSVKKVMQLYDTADRQTVKDAVAHLRAVQVRLHMELSHNSRLGPNGPEPQEGGGYIAYICFGPDTDGHERERAMGLDHSESEWIAFFAAFGGKVIGKTGPDDVFPHWYILKDPCSPAMKWLAAAFNGGFRHAGRVTTATCDGLRVGLGYVFAAPLIAMFGYSIHNINQMSNSREHPHRHVPMSILLPTWSQPNNTRRRR
ncbi:hypothetical protein EMMF5_001204 [Cystobasidiomycetes sp. EMM_F5]